MGLSSSCQSTEKSSREETYGELTPRLPGNEFEQVTRLALELAAERLERREPDGARLVGLEDREVRKRNAYPLRKLGLGKATVEQELIDVLHEESRRAHTEQESGQGG